MILIAVLCVSTFQEPQIAFASSRDGGTDVYTMRIDGSEIRRLTTDQSSYAPAWSPDGKTIAFNSHRSGGWKVWLIDADGGNPRRLTSSTAGGFNYEYFPAWSPDGKTIAFEKWDNNALRFTICTVHTDGTNERVIATSEGHSRHPSFSPDGRTIVFGSNRDGDEEIYAVAPDGSGLRQLTDNDAVEFGASFSSDGSLIVFHSNRSGEFLTYTMNPDGSGVSLVEGISAQDHPQSWTATDSNSRSIPYMALRGTGTQLLANEHRLFFQSVRDGENDIWSLDLETGERVRLTDDPAKDWLPAVRPE